MFKTTTLIIFFITIKVAFSQSKDEAIFFVKDAQINKFHTISDLEGLNKGDLLKLYSERVREIIITLPYLSLTNKPNIRLNDIGIKENDEHIKVLKKNNEFTKKNIEITQQTIEEFVPYADTGKIIWTILYYEEMIKKMRLGSKGNF